MASITAVATNNPFTVQVPEPLADLGSLTYCARAMKQNLEILTGARGNSPFDRAVLFSDLTALGLIDGTTLAVSSSFGTPPTGTASGDLAGIYPSPTVVSINGVSLGSTTATAGNLLIGSGTQWVTHAASGDWTITSAGVNTVAKVHGVTYPASPSTNTFPLVTGANTVTYTATSQIPGSATNDSASAGNVGEFISSTVLVGAGVAPASGTAADVTSVSLTAGDWDVVGSVGENPAAGTVLTQLLGWTSTTSATAPTAPNSGGEGAWAGNVNTLPVLISAGQRRASHAGTTTNYLTAFPVWSVAQPGCYGFIGARRRR